jgi:tetratricopeptide (TPR) repeat protein
MRARSALTSLVVAAFALSSLEANADPPKGKEIRRDPENRKGLSPYMELVLKGDASFVARDVPGAIAAYQDAIKMKPDELIAFYRLGEAEQDSGKLDDADKAWEAALGRKCHQGCDRHNTHENMRAKVLFAIAGLRERQHNWPAAKEAWESYSAFVKENPNVSGYPATAIDRIKQVDRRVQLEADYGKVKERIAARVAEKEREATENAKKDKLNK